MPRCSEQTVHHKLELKHAGRTDVLWAGDEKTRVTRLHFTAETICTTSIYYRCGTNLVVIKVIVVVA